MTKQSWMKRGAHVLALSKKGTITRLIQNQTKSIVYYIHVRLEGERKPRKYHPTDVILIIN